LAVGGSAAGVPTSHMFSIWGLIECIQIIFLFVYITVNIPEALRRFFAILSFANLSIFPNMFNYFVEDAYISPPPRFVEQSNASVYLLNTGDTFTAFLIILGTAVIVLIGRMIKPSNERIKSMAMDLKYSAFLRLAIEGFVDLNLATAL
jgi:hypothetical protein